MHRPAALSFALHLVLGGLVCLAGSAAGLWLPPGLALLLGAVAVCRICWLEDNIHDDLLRADRLPEAYRNCRSRRQSLFGGSGGDETEDPVGLAELLRIQSLAWSTFAWGIGGGLLLSAGPGSGAPVLAALALALALRAADYFAVAQTLVLAGRPMPRHLLSGEGPLHRIVVNARPRD